MGIRSFVRSAAKPLAMTAVAGTVALSLVVSTPSNAQAFVDADDIAKAAPRVFGAVKTAAPTVMAVATSVTPTGWAVKALWMLGTLAFETSDMWLPYVTGEFGTGEPDTRESVPLTTGGVFSRPEHKLGVWNASGSKLTLRNYWTGTGTGTTSYHVAWNYTCRWQDGTTTTFKNKSNFGNATIPFDNFLTFDCTAVQNGITKTGVPISGVAGLAGDGPLLPLQTGDKPGGPSTFTQWGEANTKTFDPRGSNVGYQGQSECIASDGTVSWITGDTVAGSAGAVKLPACAAAGKGHGTGASRIIAFKPDGTQAPVWEMPRPPSDPSTPLCDTTLPTSGCTLEVLKDDQPCVAGDVECENWASEKSKDPARWKCKFGPYTLPMSACNLLEQAYRIGGAIATEKNTDGDPSTQDNNSYSGQPVPQPAPAPVAQAPGTTTGTAPTPGAAGQPSPSADAPARSCWPTGWAAFNPLEWVLKPLGCAFIPSKDIQKESNELSQKAMTKAPLSFVSAIAATAPASVGGQGACPAWVVNIASNVGGMNSNYSKNVVCDSSFIQAIVNARPALFALISGAMLWPFLRSLWYSIIPVVRVVPTGGK